MLDLYKMYTTVNNKPPLNRERHPNGTISDNIWTSCFESSVCVEKLLNFAFFYTIHFWKRIGWKKYNCVCLFCYSIKHTVAFWMLIHTCEVCDTKTVVGIRELYYNLIVWHSCRHYTVLNNRRDGDINVRFKIHNTDPFSVKHCE